MSHVNSAIEAAGGVSALARMLKVTDQRVCNWRARDQVPPEFVLGVEKASGFKVSRHQLRPDVFGSAPDAPPGGAAPANAPTSPGRAAVTGAAQEAA